MRTRNWDTRLVTWAERVRGQPFVWGETDCGSLVKQAYKIITGKRCPWPYYKGKTAAMRAMTKVGGIPAALEKVAKPVGRGFAQSGDVVLVKVDDGYGMGIVVGDNVVGTYPGYPVTLVPLRVIPDTALFWRV